MIKVLITGKNSYIGTSVENWLKSKGNFYQIQTLDLMNESWKTFDFSVYDCVFHVAGIAHDTRRKKDADLYYKINRDLAIETAEKAKLSGVSQFIFMSSMLVYNGVKERRITIDTDPKVKGSYGDSKLQADLAIQKMNDKNFSVAVIRPPMIFGKGCKGNFPRLFKLTKLPFFPMIKNERSMLHIDNLCAIVKLIIDNKSNGIFYPQNNEYFCTSEIVRAIAAANGKKIKLTSFFNWIIWCLYPFIKPLHKLFDNLTYSKEMSMHFEKSYQINDNEKSIMVSI